MVHIIMNNGSKEKYNKDVLSSFLSKPTVKLLNTTLETAELFGRIKAQLKKAGTPVPVNDIWIAAQGIESDSTIITFDKHFQKIPGIRVWPESI